MQVTRRAAVVAVACLLAACQPSPSPTATDAVSPSSGPSSQLLVLTSPRPPLPSGMADPSTPAWQPSSGFTPDAVRVLTVTALRLSLEKYRAAKGSYPADLTSLFPAYAPDGPDGKPMAEPPAASDGYAYGASGAGYTLSVRLASGQSYSTTEAQP